MNCPMRDFMANLQAAGEDGDALREAWVADPVGTGEQLGLSCEQVAILLRGSQAEVQAALDEEGCGGKYIITPWGLSK